MRPVKVVVLVGGFLNSIVVVECTEMVMYAK